MTNVTAKTKIKGKTYEILVDLDKALQVKKGEASGSEALTNEVIFNNIKSGEKASDKDLEGTFGTSEAGVIAERIIKSGEVEIPSEYKNKERQDKVKQVIDFISKNAVNPTTNTPYTPTRIEDALTEAGINIENKPIETQISRILERLRVILPIKIETKKIRILVPAIHTGKVYGLVQEYKEKENWLNNGDLEVVVNIPIGLQMDFYDKLNSITHGSALTEEVKK